MNESEQNLQRKFEPPTGDFIFLDHSKLIKSYPDLKLSYLIVEKDGVEYHLPAYDEENDQILIKDEVRGILRTFYPIYETLMAETFNEENMDFEKVSYGITLGMQVYEKYSEPIRYFRIIYGHAEIKRRQYGFSLGSPAIPKDFEDLGCIFEASERKGKKMFTYDGYIFPEEVMDILLIESQLIELSSRPLMYKGNLSDVWRLKRKP